MRNSDLYKDQKMETVDEIIKKFAWISRRHEGRFHQQTNVEAIQLLDMAHLRRLKKTKPLKLVWRASAQ